MNTLDVVASVILFNNIIARTSPSLFKKKLHSLALGLIFWTEPPKSTNSVVIGHFNYLNWIEKAVCRPIDAPSRGLGIFSNTSQNVAMNPEEVKAAICSPPCTCADCEQGYYTCEEQMMPPWFYRRSISTDEAKQIAASHVNFIHQDRKYLIESLAKYGDIIINRWKKKSQDKRQSLLLEAIPNLCEKRWIIPRHGYTAEGTGIPPINSDGQMELRSVEIRHQLLLHWLNLEVLKTNPIYTFCTVVQSNAKSIVMYGLRYGEVVDWKAGPAHRADILGFPKARLVLEAQAHLMVSLRRVVDYILQGIDENTPLGAEKWKSMVSLGFRHSSVVELWSPFTNQAFSSPPLFSLTNLISLAQTRLEATIDHLWLLQTEPAYMKRYLVDICHGDAYELTKDVGAEWLVLQGITEAIMSCWRWGWIKNECEHVKSIHDRFRDNIAPGDDLPCRYDKALSALELLVVNDVNRRGGLLGTTTPQRPGFSHIYTFKKFQLHGHHVLEMDRKNGLFSGHKYAFENDLLDYCLANLQFKPDKQQKPNTWPKEVTTDHGLLFSILENHLAKSKIKEKSRLDEVLSNVLSDLAASHEMLAAIRLHRPRSRSRTLDEVLHEACAKLGKVFFKNFHEVKAPTGRKNMEWLNYSQNSRKVLEAFWQGIRKECAMVWKQNGFTEDEVTEELEYISATTTQEYLSATQAEERQLLVQIEWNQNNKINQKNQKSVKTPTQTTWGTEDTIPTSQPKQTQKTKLGPLPSPSPLQQILKSSLTT
ncbi:hypothetical protein BGAL_0011g00170 [Botrytis galanthina]|uniref:Uncharacterized protein n=1 Tax=Botrytis galanthina TaxID=278940 RepID=A0A4S8RB05_9HELO|nr:hypothetical protein BGAL_0011g00170 [Botrytis galanthina]